MYLTCKIIELSKKIMIRFRKNQNNAVILQCKINLILSDLTFEFNKCKFYKRKKNGEFFK